MMIGILRRIISSWYWTKALRLRNEGRPADALDMLDRMNKAEPLYDVHKIFKANVLMDLLRLDDAREIYELESRSLKDAKNPVYQYMKLYSDACLAALDGNRSKQKSIYNAARKIDCPHAVKRWLQMNFEE